MGCGVESLGSGRSFAFGVFWQTVLNAISLFSDQEQLPSANSVEQLKHGSWQAPCSESYMYQTGVLLTRKGCSDLGPDNSDTRLIILRRCVDLAALGALRMTPPTLPVLEGGLAVSSSHTLYRPRTSFRRISVVPRPDCRELGVEV